VWCSLAWLAAGRSFADEAYTGDAYDLASDTLLYRESHYVRTGAEGSERFVLYRCPDGRPFARKLVRSGSDAQLPDFDLLDARLNYREGARRRDGEIEVYAQRSAELPTQSAVLAPPANAVVDAGFDAFVHAQWDALARGEAVHFAFLVPSRRRFYEFKVHKVDDAARPREMTIRLSLGAWYAFLLPHIDVSYDTATRRLLRYEGLANIRDAERRNYRVRIEFPPLPRTPAKDEFDAALAAPLAADCAVVRADTAAGARGR